MGAGCSDQPSLNKVFDLNSSSMRKVDDRMTEKQEGMGEKPIKLRNQKTSWPLKFTVLVLIFKFFLIFN